MNRGSRGRDETAGYNHNAASTQQQFVFIPLGPGSAITLEMYDYSRFVQQQCEDTIRAASFWLNSAEWLSFPPAHGIILCLSLSPIKGSP